MKKNNSSHIIYGINPIIESISTGNSIDKILYARNFNTDRLKEIRKLIYEKDGLTIFQKVPVEKLNKLTSGNHQGIVAFKPIIDYQDIESIVISLQDKGKAPLLLMLDGITDVRNFGGICRSALCFGVDAIIIPARGGAAVNADAIKTSSGAIEQIPICRVQNLTDTVYLLQQYGIQFLAFSEKGENVANYPEQSDSVCLVLGSEGTGISKQLLKATDRTIRIPISGTFDSLNVSVAAGIALFLFSRTADNVQR